MWQEAQFFVDTAQAFALGLPPLWQDWHLES